MKLFYKDKENYCGFFVVWFKIFIYYDQDDSRVGDLEGCVGGRGTNIRGYILECSSIEIACSKWMLKYKNEAILWNHKILNP